MTLMAQGLLRHMAGESACAAGPQAVSFPPARAVRGRTTREPVPAINPRFRGGRGTFAGSRFQGAIHGEAARIL